MMPLHRPLAALCLLAALAPAVRAGDPPKLPDSLPKEVQQMVAEALAKQQAAPAQKEELPSLDQLRVWYRIQREKLGDNNEDVKNIAAMIKAIEPPTFSVTFPGGTVAAYLDAIRKAYPPANIVGAQGLDTVTVPPIALNDVTLVGALKPLEMVARNADGRAANLNFAFMDGVASLSIPDRSLPDAPETMIWNVTEITTGGYVSVADITAGVETALAVFPGPKPEVRFHEGTGILAVRASMDQLKTIDRVIDELKQTAHDAGNLQTAIRDAQLTVAFREADVAALERQLTANEKAANSAPTDVAGPMSAAARDTQASLERARVDLDGLRARLTRLTALQAKSPAQ